METTKNESRKMDFYRRIANNPEIWAPIRTLVKKLNEQGVLELFIRSDKVEELNALLSTKLTGFKPFITKDTYNEAFSPILLQKAVSKIYDKKQDDATDQEIKDEVKNFVDNIRWVKIFESLWSQTYMIAKFGYQPNVDQYKKVPGATEEDINNLDKAFRVAFPMGMQYEMPTRQWVCEHQALRDAIDLSVYFADDYINDVFGNIQHMSKMAMSSEIREVTGIVAISCVELQLLLQVLSELNKPVEEVDAKEVHDYVEKLQEEKPLYLMAMYYVYAHKSFEIRATNK